MTQQEDPRSVSTVPGASRADAFQESVVGLDVPVTTPKSEAWLLWGGFGLVVIGVILVFAGYWGASGTANVADQMPYLLSGGALGLALVVVGSVLIGRYSMAKLFRFWLALLVAEHRSQTDRLVEAIESSKGNRA